MIALQHAFQSYTITEIRIRKSFYMIQFCVKVIFTIILSLSLLPKSVGGTIPTMYFFESAKVRNMKLSPDGKQVAFSYEEGKRNTNHTLRCGG